MNDDNKENDLNKRLEDFISPSDIPLVDLIGGEIDNIAIAVQIFKDRNPVAAASSLILGTIQTLISFLVGITVPTKEIMDLCIKYSEDKNND